MPKPFRLTLEFDTKAALQAFLDQHTFEGGTVSCVPAPTPESPPIAALAVKSGVLDTDTWLFDLTGTVDPEGVLTSVTLAWGDSSPDTNVALSNGAIVNPEVSHEWPAGEATYTITLTVVDGTGLAQTARIQVQVDVVEPENQAPIAALTFVSGEFSGSPVVLSTTGTTDPDGSIVSWTMDWQDGPLDSGGAVPATLSHTYATPGTRTGTFTVTDNLGAVGVVTMVITVKAPAAGNPPTATLSLTSGTTFGQAFVFAINGSDPDLGAITWELNFGEGTPVTGTGADLPGSRSHAYSAVGSYTAVFRVTDSENLTTTDTVAVVVAPEPDPDPDPENQSPIPQLVFVSGQFVGDTIVLDTSGTVDLDGSIASWSLDWADGQPPDGATGVPPTNHARVAVAVGTRTIVFTVVDNLGKTGVATLEVTIALEPDPEPNRPPTASLTKTSGSIAGDSFVFALDGSDPEGGAVTWSLDFGDGSGVVTGTTLPTTRAHVYTTAGNYVARFQVTDSVNLTTSVALSVTVFAIPSPGTYPYYDGLAARADRLYAFPLRSQAEIDSYKSSAKSPPRIAVVYDPAFDACLQQINPAVTGVNTPQQKHLPLVIPAGTTFFLTWDNQLDSGWTYLGTGYIPNAQKSYRVDLPNSTVYPPSWIAFKHFWQNGPPNGALAEFKLTTQTATFVLPPTTYSSETPGPRTPFYQHANRLTRVWIYYNAADKKLSVWAADSVQGVVQMLNQIAYDFPTIGVNIFRLEYDTSFTKQAALNPLSKAWNRNMVVNQGLSYSTAVSLLSTQGL